MTRAILDFARTIKPETFAAIPRRADDPSEPRYTPERNAALTAAANEYRALKNKEHGSLKRISNKHGVKQNSLYTRVYRDGIT